MIERSRGGDVGATERGERGEHETGEGRVDLRIKKEKRRGDTH